MRWAIDAKFLAKNDESGRINIYSRPLRLLMAIFVLCNLLAIQPQSQPHLEAPPKSPFGPGRQPPAIVLCTGSAITFANESAPAPKSEPTRAPLLVFFRLFLSKTRVLEASKWRMLGSAPPTKMRRSLDGHRICRGSPLRPCRRCASAGCVQPLFVAHRRPAAARLHLGLPQISRMRSPE